MYFFPHKHYVRCIGPIYQALKKKSNPIFSIFSKFNPILCHIKATLPLVSEVKSSQSEQQQALPVHFKILPLNLRRYAAKFSQFHLLPWHPPPLLPSPQQQPKRSSPARKWHTHTLIPSTFCPAHVHFFQEEFGLTRPPRSPRSPPPSLSH